MHHFITGVAGFIGSQLADALLADGHRVSGVDDLSLGRLAHLEGAKKSRNFLFVEGDCSGTGATAALTTAADWGGAPDMIWHLAANSDIAAGVNDALIDFSRTLTTTFATLEAAKALSVRRIAFASTSAVYGERADLLTEDSGPLLPISNYGATKLASEALISAAAEANLDRVWIFRFPNVVGPRATHGAIHDFIARLKTRPGQLDVLGDGHQTKPYLHVSELIEAMRFIVEAADAKRNVFNIGPQDEGCSVRVMAETVVGRVAPGAHIAYGEGDRGWVGDVPKFRYSTERLARLGWTPRFGSIEAIIQAVTDLTTGHG